MLLIFLELGTLLRALFSLGDRTKRSFHSKHLFLQNAVDLSITECFVSTFF